MKKVIMVAILISISFGSFAQESGSDGDGGSGGFKKENLFTGGSLDLAFTTYGSIAGLEPEFGYSINRWLDAGVVLNFVYSATFDYNLDGSIADKYHQTDLGPGAFIRVYPVNFIFLQAQYENNFIHYKTIDEDQGGTFGVFNTSASSLLLGAGYCSGREGVGGQPFFYLSISADVLGNIYSPYVAHDAANNPIILPIIRGGIQIPLFQNGSHSGYHRRRHSDY